MWQLERKEMRPKLSIDHKVVTSLDNQKKKQKSVDYSFSLTELNARSMVREEFV